MTNHYFLSPGGTHKMWTRQRSLFLSMNQLTLIDTTFGREKIYIFLKNEPPPLFLFNFIQLFFSVTLYRLRSDVYPETMKLLIQMTQGVLSNTRGPFGKVSDVGNVDCADSAFSHL